MTRWIRRVVAVVAVLAVGVTLVACDSDSTDPYDQNGNGEEPGSISITVTADGDPLSGVTVDLFEEGSTTVLETGTTNELGEVAFTDLDVGTFEVEVTVPSGYAVANEGPTRETIDVAEGGESAVTFSLESTAEVVEVELINYEFTPADLTIEPGTTVRWVNTTSTFHTVTPDGHTEWNEASFNSTGDTFTHVFEEEGDFPYYCSPHLDFGMVGSVTVVAAEQ